jgi:UPF0755 protein
MADEPSWEDIFLPKAEPTEPASRSFPPALPPQAQVEPPEWQQPLPPQHVSPRPPPLVQPPMAAPQPTEPPAWQQQSPPVTAPQVPQETQGWQQPPTAQQLPPAPQHPAPQPSEPQWQQSAAPQPQTWQPPAAPQQPPAWPQPQHPAVQAPPTQQYPPTQAYPAPAQYQPLQQVPPQHVAPQQPAQPVVAPQSAPTPYPPTQAYPTSAPVEYPAPHPAAAPADPFAALFAATNETPVQVTPVAAAPAPPEQFPAPAQQPAAAVQDDPFAALFGSSAASAEPAATTTTPDPAAGSADDPFAALFASSAPVSATAAASAGGSRRESRENSGGGHGGGDSGGRGSRGGGPDGPRRKRNLLWLKITLPIVLVLAAVGGVAAFGWFNYNEQVRELLGIPLPTDYEGTGNGEEVIVTIRSGDIGSDVANTLHTAGVTMTFDAVYDYLVENPDIGFTPGNWALQQEMSAESAVAALQDPANKVTSRLLIIEGSVLPDVLEIIASTTGIDLADVQAAAADPTLYGVPAEAPSLEGYLFPATYELDGTETAEGLLQMLVDETFARLDAAGVAPESRHSVLTLAALIQREAGSNPDDFYKVSRVFLNRVDQGMLLQSDATVAYGTGNLHTVWTTDSERADANNPYNTYVHPGLPVGPIGAPGDRAIDAALHPADGPWLYFVPINLATGETVFSETVEEHEAAVELLFEWCEATPENASYCE